MNHILAIIFTNNNIIYCYISLGNCFFEKSRNLKGHLKKAREEEKILDLKGKQHCRYRRRCWCSHGRRRRRAWITHTRASLLPFHRVRLSSLSLSLSFSLVLPHGARRRVNLKRDTRRRGPEREGRAWRDEAVSIGGDDGVGGEREGGSWEEETAGKRNGKGRLNRRNRVKVKKTRDDSSR